MYQFSTSWVECGLHDAIQSATLVLPWSRDFGFRADELDPEHRELLECINALLMVIPSQDSCQLNLAGNRLVHEAHSHMQHEEALMRQAGFPELEEHRAQHEEQERQLAEMRVALQGAPHYFGSQAAFSSLEHWFIPHLIYGDRKFADFLANSRENPH